VNPPYASLLPDFPGGCRRRVIGRDPVREIWYRLRIGTGIPVLDLGGHVMRSSSSFVASSAVAILSIAVLCGLSGTAMSQTATGPASQLPGITVDAPKQVARPNRPKQVTTTVASRRASPATQTPSPAPNSVLAQLATLEKTSSNCTDGCQTSFKSGNAPWNGCNASGGVFSPTCRNVRNFKTYTECVENGLLLGYRSGEQWAYCTSLAAGQKFQAAELKPSGRPRSP